jgi:hypothetical protein
VIGVELVNVVELMVLMELESSHAYTGLYKDISCSRIAAVVCLCETSKAVFVCVFVCLSRV